ncbi:MAG: hypothetical protein KY448_17245, partial [Cyanobacteria bacterium 0813]|nr:hypothetical protein [Cyanobacteria bacterium 0813]
MLAAGAPSRDSKRSNTEAAGARERPQSRVGAKKGKKNVKRVKKNRRENYKSCKNLMRGGKTTVNH